MKRYINMALIGTIVAVAVIVACNKKLNVTDQNDPTTASYFKIASELQNGVNGAYSSMRSGNLVGREWFFTHDMRGWETNSGGAQLEAARAELLKQPSPSPSNPVMTSVWTGAYQMINRANQVIASAPGVTDNTASRDVSVGEAKFLRAWAYFELVTMWGPVPLYLAPVTTATGYKGQSPVADVYKAILDDLTDAVTKLPATASHGHATSGSANFLLGRVQMQNGNYTAAKAALTLVVNSGLYTLTPNFSDNFDGDVADSKGTFVKGHEYNSESIFEVSFVDKGDDNFNWGYIGEGANADASIMRSQEYGIVWGNVVPSDAILNEFEAGDPRYKFTFYEPGDTIVKNGDPAVSHTVARAVSADPTGHERCAPANS